MDLRDKILYMTYGAGLVILGMVLNTLIDDAHADKGSIDAKFGKITCREIIIEDENNNRRGVFGIGEEGKSRLGIVGKNNSFIHLGEVVKKEQMSLTLFSTDKRQVALKIDEYGGRVECVNKSGDFASLVRVGKDGRGIVEAKEGGIVFCKELIVFDTKNDKVVGGTGRFSVSKDRGAVLEMTDENDKPLAFLGKENIILKNVLCETLIIKDKNGKLRGLFGLSSGDAILEIYGEDEKTSVVYLGKNSKQNNEMMFFLKSKSKTDKRGASMAIDENGGRFDCWNKIGEDVVRLVVGTDGGGLWV